MEKRIIAGGEYHKGLRACETIASLRIDLEKETIEIFNHSEIELTFTNFDNMFWRLDDIDVSSQDNGIYTRILLDDSSIEEQNNQNKKSDSIDIKERIEPDKSFEFRTKEMEFNDTNVSFNEDGVLIRYSKFKIASFRDEFKLNRMAYKMSQYGTIIDCFVRETKG